ncbi:M15 family metallopeptidase [Ureibacillus thermophilus]|uniref:M15 family metallopeptidase n=1 Tax=Ureibacillus thermophilus TaxID=367743 RepID=UPI003623393B
MFEVVFIQDFLLAPIDVYQTPLQQRMPQIIECKEPLIKVQQEPNRLFIKPIYFQQNIPSSINSIYLREEVYLRLKKALDLLPCQYSFILYDGFRPYQVQKALFDLFYATIQKQNKELSDEEILQETLKYVALPSMDPFKTSPHITGGAIDLTLGDENGNELDLGTQFDEISEKSATRYFENHPEENAEALRNRRILYNCLTKVGFNNYSEEWWHYDFGNISWARRAKEKIVRYGPIIAEINNHDVKEYRYL